VSQSPEQSVRGQGSERGNPACVAMPQS